LVWLTRSRQVRLVAATGAAVLLAAGCSAAGAGAKSAGASGSTRATLTAAEAVNLAATHAQQATSFTGTLSVKSTGSPAISMSGTISGTTRPSFLSAGDFPTVTVNGLPLAGGVSEIVTSSAVYLRMSTISALTPKPWIEISFSGLKVAGVNFSQVIQQVEGSSLLTQTELLAHASDVRRVGTTILSGVPVTEYTGQVRKGLTSDGFTTADFRIWLDDQQQVRKLIITEQGSNGDRALTMVVTSINQPANVQLPPASQVAVIPASELNSVG
jgi:hypothetical protein